MKSIIKIRHLDSSSSVLCFLMTPDMIDLIRGDLNRCVSRERLGGRLDFQGEVTSQMVSVWGCCMRLGTVAELR